MEISFINDEYSADIDECLAFAAKNGIKYIELRKIGGKNVTELTKDEAFALSEKITSAGILVSSVASPFLKWRCDEDKFYCLGQQQSSEQDYFTALMDLADIFGAPNIRIFSYLRQDGLSMEELGQKLDIYSQAALNRGISLLLENDAMCNIGSIKEMHQLFELYGFSNIFPLLDLGETVASEDDYDRQDLQDLINKCQYFYLKDYDAELKRYVVIGEGNVDYEGMLSDKLEDTAVIFSLEGHTGYPEDMKMSLNIIQSWEND